METKLKVTLLDYTPEPEKLIAAAAKLCYSSSDIEHLYENQTPEKVESFLNRLVNIGHCFDEETEVLTSTGFKPWKDITENDLIGAINPTTIEFEGFEKPTQLFNYEIDDDMIEFNHKLLSLKVTTGHNLFCSISNTTKNRVNPTFNLIRADETLRTGKEVWESPLRMLRSANNKNNEANDSDIIFALYGFFIGDGNTTTNHSIAFHLKKKRKIDYLKNLCEKLNLKLDILKNDNYSIKNLKDNFKEMFYNKNKDKTFPNSFFTMTKNQFDYFLDGLHNSDGNYMDYIRYHKSICYYTMSKELKDKIQALCAINGKATSVKVRKTGCYVININRNKDNTPMFNDARNKKAYAQKVHYKGNVYCATVSTGLLMIRRNGFVCLCGNCSPMEHISFSFGIEGVSRTLTHQLVRHRIGVSVSQKSQRYVSEGQFEYITPDQIKDNYHTNQIYTDLMQEIQQKYNDMVDILLYQKIMDNNKDWEEYNKFFINEEENYSVREVIDKFKKYDKKTYSQYEKSIIEDVRYILPNATETKLVVTMNFRALMNFCQERCCMRAQWEIRELANEMIRLVKPLCPHLYKLLAPSCVTDKCKEGYMSCGKAKEMREFFENI
jgi:thymidylate synthase (FAD)